SSQGKYPQAEPLYQQALAIREKALGPEHPDVASTLSSLATNYSSQGKYPQAEPLYQQARAIQEKALGPEHPDVASTLSNMATNYSNQGKFLQAEQLYRRLYTLYLRALGPGHIKTMEAMKLYTAATQKVRQRNNEPYKTKRRGRKHR
ncbi:MAG: tetratricopeptide repeat-containing protein, partial [Ktedonobacteraceae bacterium]